MVKLVDLEQMRAFLEVEVAAHRAPPVQTQATRLLLEWAVGVQAELDKAEIALSDYVKTFRDLSASTSSPTPPGTDPKDPT
jgi:hypothetical protein